VFQATDNEGAGLSTKVPLRITLLDDNDNPPKIAHPKYRVTALELADELEAPLTIAATDPDSTSEIEYRIISGNEYGLFKLDPHSGQLTINGSRLKLPNVDVSTVELLVEVCS